MNQILVASDFSACAGNAMEYALGLAKVLNLQVCVIHAIGVNEGVDNNIFNAIYIEDYHKNKREALTRWAGAYTNKEEYLNVPVLSTVDVGTVAIVISKYIESNPVELLVLGTMGSTGIAGLFGSNASTVLLKSKIPTLIVPLESHHQSGNHTGN